VLWIRRAVPEPEEWQTAHLHSGPAQPHFVELFRGSVRRITLLTLVVCALSLTAHWAFLFWYLNHLRNLPDLAGLDDAAMNQMVSKVGLYVTLISTLGNFVAAALAQWLGYRRAIALLCLGYFLSLFWTYSAPRSHDSLWYGYAAIATCQGIFALFTMYLPPLFPTLLRTTGAGFCYNIGRIAAGLGTVFFGLFSKVGDYRLALLYSAFLLLPAAAVAWFLPEAADEIGGYSDSGSSSGLKMEDGG
jgi:hypothetical protein